MYEHEFIVKKSDFDKYNLKFSVLQMMEARERYQCYSNALFTEKNLAWGHNLKYSILHHKAFISFSFMIYRKTVQDWLGSFIILKTGLPILLYSSCVLKKEAEKEIIGKIPEKASLESCLLSIFQNSN
ncbi:hypothetical protein H1C71_026291 [Ictidomys tridecemlineatus]|nr:hypothetical protein H1C71_026291 [Ictidomys tridecemlineatus]